MIQGSDGNFYGTTQLGGTSNLGTVFKITPAGVVTTFAGLAGTFLLSHFTDVSQYALNIVTLIGLAAAIDYSLFVVNRYRDELAAGSSLKDALAQTMATAGRAITFSGVAVAVSLSWAGT